MCDSIDMKRNDSTNDSTSVKKKIVLNIITAVIMLLLLSACGHSEEKQVYELAMPDVVTNNTNATSDSIDSDVQLIIDESIKTIIRNNASVKVSERNKVQAGLNELAGLDPDTGTRWTEIVNYWNEVNRNGFINTSLLPDDLPADNSLCLVVLGYQLNPDGSMKDELIGRLEKALSNYEKYPESYIIVTGGGTATQNQDATEADCMADWLINNGVSGDKIIIENMSKTTVENALFSYAIICRDYPEIRNIAIVTSDYHIPLGCMLFGAELMLDRNHQLGEISVVAHSAYKTNVIGGFSMSSQADWLIHLFERQ